MGYHKKVQWKDHCKKLDNDLRSLQDTNNHLISEYQKIKKVRDQANITIQQQQTRITSFLDTAHAGPANDVTMMTSVFPLVTDIRAQFDDFFSQKRNDLMDSLEEYLERKSLDLSEKDQRGLILKTWIAGAELYKSHVSTFRREIHKSLRLGKGEEPDHFTRRFVSSYMQRHHKSQTVFDVNSCRRDVYDQVGYFGELDENSDLKKLLQEVQFLCWLSA